jgi:hypothetical protein
LSRGWVSAKKRGSGVRGAHEGGAAFGPSAHIIVGKAIQTGIGAVVGAEDCVADVGVDVIILYAVVVVGLAVNGILFSPHELNLVTAGESSSLLTAAAVSQGSLRQSRGAAAGKERKRFCPGLSQVLGQFIGLPLQAARPIGLRAEACFG